VFGLANFFWWSFMFAKHDQHLRSIIPFGDDPYDAVGSFAAIVAMLAALLSLVRAFRPYRNQAPTNAQCVYLMRSQETVVLAVLLTLLSDVIAMVRHPSLWATGTSGRLLIMLLVGVAVIALAVQLIIRHSRLQAMNIRSSGWGGAVFTPLLATFVLAVYPERLIHYTAAHLLTVVIGAFILFASMRVLLISLVPSVREEAGTGKKLQRTEVIRPSPQWGVVTVVGAMIGVFAFLGEMSEAGSLIPSTRLLFVAFVFIGLGVAGVLIAYAFLGSPLGLGSSILRESN
jgi:hypothetical protein